MNFYWIYTYICWREVHLILLAISEFYGGWVIMEDCEWQWRIYIWLFDFLKLWIYIWLLKFLLAFIINILWDHFYWNLLNIVTTYTDLYIELYMELYTDLYTEVFLIYFYTFYTNLYMLCYIACDMYILWLYLSCDSCDVIYTVMFCWCLWCLTIWNL